MAIDGTAEGDTRDPVPTDVELTILMPCLNEAETIEACVAMALGYLEASGVVGEVLVADNGSTDGSQALATAAGARVVPVADRGYGAALMGGIAAARGRFVIMGDADASYDFASLDAFVAALRQGHQLVMGNRFRGGIADGAMPLLHRYLGNPVLSFLGRLFYGIPLGDFHCGLRGFERKAMIALELRAPGMEFASEMIVKASLNGLSMTEVPTTLAPDGRSRPPHLKTWTDGWRHLRFLLLHSPRWLFLYPGLALVMGGAGLAVLLAGGEVEIAPGVEIGIHTLITACFAIVLGVQLVVFGVLARRHAAAAGLLPPRHYGAVLGALTLERILWGAGALLVVGLSGFAYALGTWVALDFGGIEARWVLTLVTVSLTTVTVAVQLAFAGFLASAFEISGDRR